VRHRAILFCVTLPLASGLAIGSAQAATASTLASCRASWNSAANSRGQRMLAEVRRASAAPGAVELRAGLPLIARSAGQALEKPDPSRRVCSIVVVTTVFEHGMQLSVSVTSATGGELRWSALRVVPTPRRWWIGGESVDVDRNGYLHTST
jgi:hypothetical protein